jgi:hypothetical protein
VRLQPVQDQEDLAPGIADQAPEEAYQFATGFARPAGDETCGRLAESVGGEVGFVMVRPSPRISWTRDA